jgi:hypothetical protein
MAAIGRAFAELSRFGPSGVRVCASKAIAGRLTAELDKPGRAGNAVGRYLQKYNLDQGTSISATPSRAKRATRRSGRWPLLLALCALAGPLSARADEAPEQPAAADEAPGRPAVVAEAPERPGVADEASGRPVAAGEVAKRPVADGATKRPVPLYDGREPPAVGLGEGLLWAPRVVLFPLYVVFDYGIRRPVGALATLVERKQLIAFTKDQLENDELELGVWPIAFVDFGLRPSVGLEVWKRNFLVPKNRLEGHFATWGPSWVALGIVDRLPLAPRRNLSFHADWVHRPDQVFFGLGPRSRQADLSRYGVDRVDIGPQASLSIGPSFTLEAKVGERAVWFNDDSCCSGLPLRERAARGAFAVPPGFERGYTAGYQQLELTYDSRAARPAPQGGVRLDAFAEHAVDLRPAAGQQWVRYGGTAGAFIDVGGNARVIGLTLSALFADPLRGQVPFTELASLGGSGAMRGYLPGRLVDRSAMALTLQYAWPVWAWADGVMQVATGNVFGEHLSGLSPKLARVSAGTGLRTAGDPTRSTELLVGFGTETFEDGLRVTSFRLYFGGTHGF